MHEASIVESLLRLAVARVPADARLRRVHVRVGALTGISPDSMRFYFEAISPGDAELEVTIEPLRVTCTTCGARGELAAPTWSCGTCSASTLEYANGLELDLIAIEVDDAVDDSDRREDTR